MALADFTNPVLRGFRASGLSIPEALDAMDLAEYWNSLPNPDHHDPEWSNKQIAQARRILLRRQAAVTA